ncbi:MAG: energy transducer TonB, partial [Bacteroidaceae bacterium]|nr:energy transducer TonB [Bacteroidaceae bacterium]
MKKMLFTFALMALPLFALKATAQETPTDTTVYRVVEEMPEYPEGVEKLVKYIRTSTDNYWKKRYPKGKPVYPCEQGISGRIIVSFVINENGQVTDPEVLRRVDKDLDKEAIRIIKSMPRWIPGEHKGKKVKVRFTLPVM